MGIDIRLDQRHELQLKLAPQIIQSIEILQLATIDLQSLVQTELDTNEFLERAPTEEEGRVAEEPAAEETKPASEETASDSRAGELDRLENSEVWDNEIPRTKSALNYEASDRKQEAMANAAGRPLSLHEMLNEQFSMLELEDRFRAFGQEVVSYVNDLGRIDIEWNRLVDEFNVRADQSAAATPGFGPPRITLEEAEYVLGQIQTLEPKGIGARSTEECLLLQLDPEDQNYELKRRLVADHFEDLKKNRRPKIAKALGMDVDDLNQLIEELGDLDYQPGRTAVDEAPQYIYPDILIEWTPPDQYEVRLAQENYPSLRVRPIYKKILADPATPPIYKDEVRKQAEQAKWLVSAIEQRQNTLLRVAKRIVHYQRDFLEFGPHYLWPLKMQTIAEDLGIHVSTVSRATHGKYMQTHRGIFSLKFFFGGATANVDGGVESRASVKQRVKEIIASEDKKAPLSDEEIVDRLKSSFGVEVARRTVTKYRKALRIPSTRQRKVFA